MPREAELLDIGGSFKGGRDGDTEDPESLDYLVPQALVEYFCGNNNCVVTQDGNALELGVVERKYHAPASIGVFLEVNLEDEEIVRLVSCHIAADQRLHDYCGGEIPEPAEPSQVANLNAGW